MKYTESIRDHFKYIKSLFHENILVCYGTSLTAGSGWVKLLQKKLPNWYVINSGKGGMNSNWGVDNFEKKVLRFNPKIVLMEFAINDAYEGKHPHYKTPDLSESRYNVAKMIHELKKRDIKVYYMSMNPPLDMYLSGRNPAQDRPKYWKFRDEHKWIANGSYIDIGKKWEMCTDDFLFYCPDGLHPNALASRDITVPTILKALDAVVI